MSASGRDARRARPGLQAPPVGGGLWVVVLHSELRIAPPYREWNFGPDITRMPEFCAPALGTRANLVTIDADLP